MGWNGVEGKVRIVADSRQNALLSVARTKKRRAAAGRAPVDGPSSPLPRPLRATLLPPQSAPSRPLHLDVAHH